ncbi:hypothetical protein HED51_22250 [Ochrobactrum grignonense]|nr:hypothetical protein [Brucella grignonensis]
MFRPDTDQNELFRWQANKAAVDMDRMALPLKLVILRRMLRKFMPGSR